MKLYVTGSSGIKTPQIGNVPIEELELSAAVMTVKALAETAGVPWAILTSGYGLTLGGTSVAPYHGVIHEGDVDDMGSRVAKQLRELKVDELWFFVVPEEISGGGVMGNYLSVLEDAITKLRQNSYNIKMVTKPFPTRNEMSRQLRPQDIPKTYHQNKEAHMFLLRAQDEKGLWQNVRKSSFLPDLQIKGKQLQRKFPGRKVEIVVEPSTKNLL